MITMYMLIKRLKTISNNINVRLVPKVDFLDTLFTSISRLVPTNGSSRVVQNIQRQKLSRPEICN